MDYSKEERFVNAFVIKSRRHRILHELTTPAKRYDGISRFCHQSKELLDPRKISIQGSDLERLPEFRKFVRNHNESCYVMSPEFYPDEQILPLEEAVGLAAASLDAVLILGNGFAVVFGEPVKEGREKYLLLE